MNNPPVLAQEISPNDPLPIHVAKRWNFSLQYHEEEGVVWYCIKDWIAGLTRVAGLKANHVWWNFKARRGGFSTREMPYVHPTGNVGPMDYTDDVGLYTLAGYMKVTQNRPALAEIKDFLAKAGAFVDAARQNPEAAAEQLAMARRAGYLRQGKPEDWIATREQSVVTRKQFQDAIYELVENKESFGTVIGAITNDVYRALFDADVQDLRKKLGVTSTRRTPRDEFSRIALSYITIAEEAIRIHLGGLAEYDFVPVQIIRDVVSALAGAVGVQANTLANALSIDLVTGRRLIDTPPPSQGALGAYFSH